MTVKGLECPEDPTSHVLPRPRPYTSLHPICNPIPSQPSKLRLSRSSPSNRVFIPPGPAHFTRLLPLALFFSLPKSCTFTEQLTQDQSVLTPTFSSWSLPLPLY